MSANGTLAGVGASTIGCYVSMLGVGFTTFLGIAFWVDIMLLIYRFLMARVHWIPGRRQAYMEQFVDNNLLGLAGYIVFYVVLTAFVSVFHALGVGITVGQALSYFLLQPITNAFSLLFTGRMPAIPACS